MPRPGPRVSMAIVAILLGACESGPSTPTPGYVGEWSGTTSQGVPIAFAISSAERLTKVSVSSSFNGCTGSNSVAPDAALQRPPVPSDARLLDYETAPPGTPNRMLFHFLFSSSTSASGMVTFVDF